MSVARWTTDGTSAARVSRAELAVSPTIHRLHGAALLLFGSCAVVLPLLLGRPLWTAIPATIAGLAGALWIFTTDPPPLGSRRGHLLVATSWVQPTLSLVGVLPAAAPVLVGYGFVAPLAGFRLDRRWQVAAHCLAAATCVFAPLALGLTDRAYALGAAMLIVCFTLVPVGVVWVLETAERQSDQLSELSQRDPLTGVGNRRMLEHRLAHEIVRHAREDQPFALLAYDLDGFKALNDTFGHHAGDTALVDVANALLHTLRAADTITRTGGDEFIVLLPDTTAAGAEHVASATRRALADVQTPAGPLCSGIGISVFPRDGVDPAELLHAADAALLADKQRRAAAHQEDAAWQS